MKKLLYLSIFIFVFCLLPKTVEAGTIFKPVFQAGLVGYWDFDEGAGDKAYDKSGYGNHGTWAGTGSHWANGKIGEGGNFNGSSDYVNITNADNFVTSITLSAWVKSSTAGRYIIAKDPPSTVGDNFIELTHFRWDAFGRTFKTGIPNQYVYKSKIGQRNIRLASGEYAPYIWDEKSQILQFADNSIYLKGNEMEFWQKSRKVHQVSFYPEAKEQGIWQRETAVVSNLKVEEIKTDGPIDYIKITYDLETRNQKSTIALRAGGSNEMQFSFNTQAKEAGEYRLAVEHNSANLEPIYAANPHSSQQSVHIGYWNPDTGFYWRWQADEEKHYAEIKSGKLALLLNQDEYQANETKTVYPDTWGTDVGIAANEDDGEENYLNNWEPNGYEGAYTNYTGCNVSGAYHIGLRWTGITIPQGSTINSGILDVYRLDYTGSPTATWYAADEDNMAQWSSSIKPSNRTKTAATLPWVPTANGWENLTITSIIHEVINRDGWVSGNAIGIFAIGNATGNYDYIGIEDYGNAGTDEAELTITYASSIKTNVPYGLNITSEGKGQIMFMSSSTTYSATSTTSVNDGNWHHVLGTYDSETLRVYVDGVLENTNTDPSGNLPTDDGPIRIGADYQNTPANFFNGIIDEVRIYNRVLGPSEIQRAHKLSQPKFLAPPGTGLVGYWSFDEGSGTKVGDFSGNGNNGTFSGSMAETDWIDGRVGKALNLNDDGKNVYFGSPANLQLGNTGTISAWLKYGTIPHHAGVVSKNDWGLDRNGYNLGIGSSHQKIEAEIADASGYNQAITNHAYNDNQWHHVVFTWDGSFLRIYIDGAEDAVPVTQTLTPVSNVYDLYIGRIAAPVYADYNYHGQIDEVRIYNRALETSEITALYNSGLQKVNASQNNQITNGLVGFWSFNGPDIDGNTATDRSGPPAGGGNDGTITGATKTIGQVGQALNFDGVDDSINAGSASSLDNIQTTGSGLTVSMWVNIKGNIGQPYLINKGNGNGTGFWGVLLDGSDPFLRFMKDFGTAGWVQDLDVSTDFFNLDYLNQWKHIVVTWDGTSFASGVKFYINTIQRANMYETNGTGSAVSDADNDLLISAPFSGGDINGIIDEVRVYNRVLTSDEIKRLYNMGH